MDREEAERLTAILRKAGVLRSAIDLRSVRVDEKLGEDPLVELTFESGKRLAGRLTNDFGPISAWSNPYLEESDAQS